MQKLFGKAPTIEEQRYEKGIQTEENKIKKEMKTVAKRPDGAIICRTLAKELIHSRKAKDRIYTSKAQLNSVSMQLQQQVSSMKLAGSMQKSAQVMQLMNKLVKLPQIQMTMQTMAKEMLKAGLIEEMMEDALDFNDDELEEAAEEEVDKVMQELIGDLGTVPKSAEKIAVEPENEADVEEDNELQERLKALRS